MSVVLKLKLRPLPGSMSVSVAFITGIMQQPRPVAEQQLYNKFQELLGNGAADRVHDKMWLETIVNWTPTDGQLSLTEAAPWFKLAARVARLDDQREGDFTLSSAQADLIFNRLKDERFQVRQLNAAFAQFCLDFMAAFGKRLDSISEDMLFDEGEDEV
jgi:hypothetical protein